MEASNTKCSFCCISVPGSWRSCPKRLERGNKLDCHIYFTSVSNTWKSWISNSDRAATNQTVTVSLLQGKLGYLSRSASFPSSLMAFWRGCSGWLFPFWMATWLRRKVTWSYISILKKSTQHQSSPVKNKRVPPRKKNKSQWSVCVFRRRVKPSLICADLWSWAPRCFVPSMKAKKHSDTKKHTSESHKGRGKKCQDTATSRASTIKSPETLQ